MNKNYFSNYKTLLHNLFQAFLGESSESSPSKTPFLNFAIQGTVLGQVQQPIISMEDEDTLSDQDMVSLDFMF